jgi:hypothetical protein
MRAQVQSERSDVESSGLMMGQAYPAKKTIPRVCKTLGESFSHQLNALFIFSPDLRLLVNQNIGNCLGFALRQVGFVRYAFKLWLSKLKVNP